MMALVVLCNPAPCDSPRDAARRLLEAGNQHYASGRFADAVDAYEQGLRLVPEPAFLLNLAQAHRQLGDLGRARGYYERYLAAVPHGNPLREQAERVLRRLLDELEAAPGAGASAKDREPPPPARAVQPAPPDRPPLALEKPPPRPFLRRHWWIIPASLLVSAGVAVGLGLGLTAARCDPEFVRCLDVTLPESNP